MTPAGTSTNLTSSMDDNAHIFCPADHVPDWQLRILLGMVEARSVHVKNTMFFICSLDYNPTYKRFDIFSFFPPVWDARKISMRSIFSITHTGSTYHIPGIAEHGSYVLRTAVLYRENEVGVHQHPYSVSHLVD